MYLILNDQEIYRVRDVQLSQLSLGLDEHGVLELQSQQPHLRLRRDPAGYWTKADTLQAQESRVFPGQQVAVNKHLRLLVCYTAPSGSDDEIHKRKAKARFNQVLSEIHQQAVAKLQLTSNELSERERRAVIILAIQEEVAHRLASGTLLPLPYLVAQAFHRILMNRLYRYGTSQQAVPEEPSLIQEQFHLFAEKLEGLIRLQEEAKEDKADRIELLLPWALEHQSFVLSKTEVLELVQGHVREELLAIIFGYGPLQPLLEDEEINDILVQPSGAIFVERNGKIMDAGVTMPSRELSHLIVEQVVAQQGKRIDRSNPIVDARMKDGSRLNAVIEPISEGPSLTIRRFRRQRLTIGDLIALESLPERMAHFLCACVHARLNIAVSGGTGSGKTTLLNCLCAFIPPDQRIITIEDVREITIAHNHVTPLQTRPPNLEGEGEITQRQLVKNALRMRPDRIIVGEVRDGAALDMLQAMNTGHDGSLTTLHANTPLDALNRLVTMASMAETKLSEHTLYQQIASALSVIIQISRMPGGQRRVTAISEVVGLDEADSSIILEDIYKLSTSGKIAFTGYVPTFARKLLETRIVTVHSLF